MDVTCDRCGTVYEFDETLLSAKGTPVKCTNCGHTFKVYPSDGAEADRTTSSWRLRMRDGSVDTIDSMGELQRRITQGALSPDDEIARGDEDWKKLGAIRDLERLFEAAGTRLPGARSSSPIPPVAPRDPKRESSLPPGKRPRQPTLLGVSPISRMQAGPGQAAAPEARVEPEGLVEPAPEPEEQARRPEPESSEEPDEVQETEAPRPEASAASYRSPYRDSMPATSSLEAEDAEFEEAPPVPSPARTSTPPPAYYDDDDDIPELPARTTSPLRWLVLIVIFGGLALVVTQWERVALLIGVGSDPALIAAGIAEGDAALAEGHGAAYQSAIEAYERAVEAGGGADAEVMAKLSQAYALTAQAMLDAGDSEGAAVGLAQRAEEAATTATMLDARNLEAKLALVDASRLTGRGDAARERLEEVRDLSFSRTAEFYRVEARLIAAESEGRLDAGLRSARQAAELAPDGVRYLLLRARAEIAADNEGQAREALAKVLADHPEQPVAAALLAELEEAAALEAAAAAAEEPTPDAGVDSEPSEAAPEPEEAEKAPDPKPAVKEPAPRSKPEPQASKVAPAPTQRREAARPSTVEAKARTKPPELDEYDRLAAAAGSDAFVDGRPPVLDYESNMNKGREELAAGNYTRARAYFDSALEVHPGSADAMDALGDVASAVSDYGSALRYYRVAAQRGHREGYFKLGRTYEQLGRNEEAVSAYYTYVTRRPTGKHVDDARRAIQSLEPRAKLPPPPGSENDPSETEPRAPSAESPADDAPAENTEPTSP